jgi:hypothetical protein
VRRALLLWSVLPGCVFVPGGALQGIADEVPSAQAPAVQVPWPRQGTERRLCEEERVDHPFLLFTLPGSVYQRPAMSCPQPQRPSRTPWVSTR